MIARPCRKAIQEALTPVENSDKASICESAQGKTRFASRRDVSNASFTRLLAELTSFYATEALGH